MFQPDQQPSQPKYVREIPVIREGRSDSPRRSQTPTRVDSPLNHQGSPSQKVYNIPVQYVDKSDQPDSFRHGSPLRHFEGRNSPRSGSPWHHERSQSGDIPDGAQTGPYGWSGWVGGGSPNRPQGMPHHPLPKTPPFPVDTPPQAYTYPGGNTAPPEQDNSKIHYPQGIVHPPSSQPADNEVREIPITKIPPQEHQSTNGPTVKYKTEENTPENVNLEHETPPRVTQRVTENLKAEERKATRSPSPSPAHLSPLEQVELVQTEINSLQDKVNNFNGKMKDKDYKFLEEMLTRCMLKLDRIESQGKEEVRLARKTAIRAAQSGLDQLELKAFSNDTVTGGDDPEQKEEEMKDNQVNNQQEMPECEQQQTNNSGSEGKRDPGHVTDMMVDSGVTC